MLVSGLYVPLSILPGWLRAIGTVLPQTYGSSAVWDARSGHLVLTYRAQAAPRWAVAWSPSGACIVSATGNTSYQHQKETVQIWDATNGHLANSYPIPSSSNDADGTMSVSWSPDSKYIGSGGADTMVHLWATSSCTP